MKITITHSKNPAVGWDVDVNALGDGAEQIAQVEIRVNGFPEVRATVDPPDNSWEQQLRQQGVFPGDNTVEVTVQDQNGNETRAQQRWS